MGMAILDDQYGIYIHNGNVLSCMDSAVCVCVFNYNSLSFVDWIWSVNYEPKFTSFWRISCHITAAVL